MDEGERGVAKKERGQNSHRDVDELDEVTQKTHDGKADRHCLADLYELCTVDKYAASSSLGREPTFLRGLRATSEELDSWSAVVMRQHSTRELTCWPSL